MCRRPIVGVIAVLVLGGCTERELSGPEAAQDVTPVFAPGSATPGAVYVMTNSAAANEVLAFDRGADGSLGSGTAYATGGTGSGSGLGSQGALILTHNGRWLLAVNAGSDEVSVFRVGANRLTLTHVIASGGDMPISVTVHGSLVYVLNAGAPANISGFLLSPQGELTSIPGSTRPLSGPAPGPAQVAFSPAGDVLVVTEKGTNQILTYQVQANGQASAPAVHASAGTTPFGFAFAGRDKLLVSEAFGGAPDASATSSYILENGSLTLVSGSVGTTETAACWTVVTQNARFAYVTNTGSGTVSGYAVGRDGTLSLLDADGVTGTTGAGSAPIDADFSVNSQFLYVLNSGNQTISAFTVSSDGSLAPVGGTAGLPASSVGIAAH